MIDIIVFNFVLQLESLESKEIPDIKSKMKEMESETQRIEDEITEVRHVTAMNFSCLSHSTEALLGEFLVVAS